MLKQSVIILHARIEELKLVVENLRNTRPDTLKLRFIENTLDLNRVLFYQLTGQTESEYVQ